MKRTMLTSLLLATACSSSGTTRAPESEPSQPAAAPAEAEATAAAEPAVPELLAVGVQAPDFTAVDHLGNEVSLAGLKGKPVVLYWYPKDETPG